MSYDLLDVSSTSGHDNSVTTPGPTHQFELPSLTSHGDHLTVFRVSEGWSPAECRIYNNLNTQDQTKILMNKRQEDRQDLKRQEDRQERQEDRQERQEDRQERQEDRQERQEDRQDRQVLVNLIQNNTQLTPQQVHLLNKLLDKPNQPHFPTWTAAFVAGSYSFLLARVVHPSLWIFSVVFVGTTLVVSGLLAYLISFLNQAEMWVNICCWCLLTALCALVGYVV